jgi:hypothetical protein
LRGGGGEKLGASMGELVEVDIAGDGAGWGRSLRLRVVIDLSQPLERGRALKLGGKSFWVSFRYENLPLFCFHCGRVVHGQQGCPRRQLQRRNQEESKEWGIWLRADQKRKEKQEQEDGRRSGRNYARTDAFSDDDGNIGEAYSGKEVSGIGGNPKEGSYCSANSRDETNAPKRKEGEY